MLKFLVKRTHDTVLVYLMRNKNDNTYSYVNITKGHICPCRFETIEEAIVDMEKHENVISYEILE